MRGVRRRFRRGLRVGSRTGLASGLGLLFDLCLRGAMERNGIWQWDYGWETEAGCVHEVSQRESGIGLMEYLSSSRLEAVLV